jgi:hypothetical protein
VTSPVPRLTLDTSLLLEFWKEQSRRDATEALLDLARRGEVELAVTARIREDVPNQPLASEIDNLDELNVAETASVTRADHWVLGRDMLGSDEFAGFENELLERAATTGAKVPDFRDRDHLHAHFLQDRTAFLTWDRAILSLADELKARFGIVVLRPDVFLRAWKGP